VNRAGADELRLNAFPLVFGGRSIYGSLTGTPIDGEDTLAFSVLENIRPMIETVPLEQAADAYARMMEGKARFRMVLVTEQWRLFGQSRQVRRNQCTGLTGKLLS
jgi:alcohol dehydrogenase, propanol-preferring